MPTVRDSLKFLTTVPTSRPDAGVTLAAFTYTEGATISNIAAPPAGSRIALYSIQWGIQNQGTPKNVAVRGIFDSSPVNFCKFHVPTTPATLAAQSNVFDYSMNPLRLAVGAALERNIDSGFSGNAFLTCVYKIITP